MEDLNNRFWAHRPTLVTGGTGFIGGWVTRALLRGGAHVVCIVRDWTPRSELLSSDLLSQVTVVRGNITDEDLVQRTIGEYEIDTVIHLAAQAIVGVANRNPVSTFETNIGGTWCVLEACRRSATVKQIVVASSDKAYGDQEQLPYTEDAPLQGMHPYDVSKSCADLIAQTYAVSYGLPVTITRCGNFYGGGDLNWNRIVPGTIRSVLNGERPVIRSDGKFVRDYLYAADAASAYLLLAESLAGRPELRGRAFNFSNETQVTVLELVNLILRCMGSSLEPVVKNEASNEIINQYLSAAAAREVLGWRPSFSLTQGIGETIAWYRAFLDAQPHARVLSA